MLNPEFKKKLPEVIDLLKKHQIKKAFVFGSVITDRFKDDSDIDFLIHFEDGIDPLAAGEHWWNLHDELRDLLHREVDLVTERSLRNPYFIEELNKTKHSIKPTKTFIEYDSNLLIQDAVERNLITIGEFMKQLLTVSPQIPISNSRRVVDARNKLTHRYDEIENVQVWSILINHLPILKNEVRQLLGEK